jgi:hypothetical protein
MAPRNELEDGGMKNKIVNFREKCKRPSHKGSMAF